MQQNLRECAICGEKYPVCRTCEEVQSFKPWRTIVDTMEMIRVLGEKGSRLAVSDAGVAILFAQAALEGASLNIFINTKMMKDQEEAERLNYLADQLIATGKELKETTYDAVLKGIRP